MRFLETERSMGGMPDVESCRSERILGFKKLRDTR